MKASLIWVLKIMLGLGGLMLIFSGFQWGFMPTANFETYRMVIDGIPGRSMVQTDISAPLMAGGLFLILFAFKGNEWFLPMLIFGGFYLLVRTITLFTVGFDNGILFGVVFELVIIFLMILLKRLRETKIGNNNI